MSQTTKRALAASLKKLLIEKPLDKITVIDITEDCEVNRQTFYYHFQDIYDLIEWIYISEAGRALDGMKTYDTWQQGFLHICEYVKENKAFVINTYHSVSREFLENFLHHETYNLLIGVVEEKSQGMSVRDEDKSFIANFYKYAFVGLMLEWVRQGMKEDPKNVIEHISVLIQGDISRMLNKYRTDSHH
jgi:probable dihydroxyacetone kinase regulator